MGGTAFDLSSANCKGHSEELSFGGKRFFEAPGGEIVVFIRVRGRGLGSGVEIDNGIAWVWTFRGDEAIRLVV